MYSTQLGQPKPPFEKEHDVHVDNEQDIHIMEPHETMRTLAATLALDTPIILYHLHVKCPTNGGYLIGRKAFGIGAPTLSAIESSSITLWSQHKNMGVSRRSQFAIHLTVGVGGGDGNLQRKLPGASEWCSPELSHPWNLTKQSRSCSMISKQSIELLLVKIGLRSKKLFGLCNPESRHT